MTYRFVTSMSKKGYDEYGKNFLESFNLTSPYPLTVFSEDVLGDWGATHLLEEPGLPEFLSLCESPEPSQYQWQAGRFAKKIFAVTSDKLPKDGWRIWLDADVIVDRKFGGGWMKGVCPDDYTGSYLGRKDWHHSECGWVAYNLERGGLEFLRDFRDLYTSGGIFEHLEWHDSYLFDRLREHRGDKWFNLSEGIPGMHPWDESPLGKVMRHLKGPLRKSGKTGNVPADYWSEKERAV